MSWLPWTAHLYTGLGAACALLATLATIGADYRAAFLWLAVQVAIDATDGMLARALKVKERLPHFDGARLDDIVDYLTYVFVPVLLAIHAGLLPGHAGPWVGTVVLLASGYGFAQTAAKVKTSDYFFTGFPSYWNIVVLYLYVLAWPPAINAVILLVFAVLVFVPLRYVYPSRTITLATVTNGLGIAWALAMLWILWQLPERETGLTVATLLFPAYYFGLSFYLNVRAA
jgi:phosphatidylcholine synthase